MRHAYLIIAHNEFGLLEKLLKLIDHKDNDIYVHIDKCVKNFDFNYFKSLLKKSNIFFTERTNVNWGDYSQINSELVLLKASCKGKYDYYHLLSGVDLPLKSQKEIHDFFEKNNGKQFVHMVSYNKDVLNRISLYHPFCKFKRRFKNKYLSTGMEYFTKIIDKVQKILKVNRLKNINFDIKYGANWFSITHELVMYILSNEDFIKKYFKSSLCADELFLQTLVYNSKFKNDLYYKKEDGNYISCLRYVVWDKDDCKNGSPHTWRASEYEELMNSDYLFARKFNSNIDNDIINMIFNSVSAKNEKGWL